ncbi:MAG: Cu-binding protein [Alyxoria varia]|nr:MAG: Cu-binding protein [Alyxoria varia]
MQRKRIREASKGYGKPRIGGDFELVDQNENTFSSEDMKGKFALVYFGFSHCPDICPDELDKMSRMVDMIKSKRGNVLRPVVITCDPARDSPPVLKTYLSEFHPQMIGLTGTWEQIRDVCKAYRVYFSTPPHVKPGQDYLVDHSIYFYLMASKQPRESLASNSNRQSETNYDHNKRPRPRRKPDDCTTPPYQRNVQVAHTDKFLGRNVTPESWKEVVPTELEGEKARVKFNLE